MYDFPWCVCKAQGVNSWLELVIWLVELEFMTWDAIGSSVSSNRVFW